MMMAFRISTGFFIWDVYKWLLVFLLSALVAWLAVSVAVRRRGGRLFPEPRQSAQKSSAVLPVEIFIAAFSRLFIEPWGELPSCGIFGIAALVILFVTAIFLG